MSETTKEHRDCLAKGFPFWNDLTPDEQDMLCRYTRPVHYAKGARVHSPLESCVGILLLRSGQLPPVRRGGVHPVGLLRDGLGEHRPVY